MLEDALSLKGNVVIGNSDADNGIFIATNATNFPEGISNGTLSVGISDSGCNSGAYTSASKFSLEQQVVYKINSLGGVEGDGGWFQQPIRELQGNSTLPVSLAELVNGIGSEYGLAVYILSSDEDLLGCANMEKLDMDKAAAYSELLNGLSHDQEVAKDDPASGSKIGQFMVSTIVAAVGIAVMLGNINVLAL